MSGEHHGGAARAVPGARQPNDTALEPQSLSPNHAIRAREVIADLAVGAISTDDARPDTSNIDEVFLQATPTDGGKVLGGRQGNAVASGAAAATGSAIARRRARAVAQLRHDLDEQAEAKAEAAREADLVPPTQEASAAVQKPRRMRREFKIGGVHPGQVVTWELAAAGVLAAHRASLALVVPVAIVAIIAVLLTAVRWNGRWLYEWLGIGVRFRARKKLQVVNADEPGREIISAVARGGALRTLYIEDASIGVLTHDHGYTAIIQVSAPSAGTARARTINLPALSELLQTPEIGQPTVTAQFVTSTISAPSLHSQQDAAAHSYRELTGGMVPSVRRTRIAVQVLHGADGHTGLELELTLINTVRRLDRRLSKSGLTVKLLDRSEVSDDLVALVLGTQSETEPQMSEKWRTWNTGDIRHCAYRLLEWPDLDDGSNSAFFADISLIPTISTTVVFAARGGRESIEVEATVRMGFPDQETAVRADEALITAARAHGARVQRMDGEQIFGARASLPTGGFAA